MANFYFLEGQDWKFSDLEAAYKFMALKVKGKPNIYICILGDKQTLVTR
jgi:hypothetical protein